VAVGSAVVPLMLMLALRTTRTLAARHREPKRT